MHLDECKNFISNARPNNEFVDDLIWMSNTKEETIKSTQLTKENINAFVPMAYDSLREIMDAIANLHGYKVTSHICLGVLLKSLYHQINQRKFDRFRYIRNSINYYAKKISFEQGKSIIEQIFKMKKEMLALLEEML